MQNHIELLCLFCRLLVYFKEYAMRKLFLILVVCLAAAGCACPQTPNESDLLRASRQFRPALFESGARGVVIASLSDNVSDDGFFGVNYNNIMAFRNIKTNEVFYMSTILDGNKYDTAMLPIGTYEVTNLYLQYIYTTTEQYGNTQVVRTVVETDEHYEGNSKIRFTVRPQEITYIGHFALNKTDNEVAADGHVKANSFSISDKSDEISFSQKNDWQKKFGQDFVVRLAQVQ